MANRRTFLNRAAAVMAFFRPVLRMLGAQAPAGAGTGQPPADPGPAQAQDWEYIVVGSGAGGGTVAARLAELGHSVLLLEAGADSLEKGLSGGNALYPGDTLPEDYQVPAFHPNATENTAMKWDFFVRHYADTEQQKRDEKYDPERDGVLYPRAGTLGGCTAHNAMILVYPHNQDWQDIADETGDSSWEPGRMRQYFQKLEDCHHRGFDRFLHRLTGLNLTRHGFGGWLRTEKALPVDVLLDDKRLFETAAKAAGEALKESKHEVQETFLGLETQFDPNDWLNVQKNGQGIHYTPLTTSGHARTSTRDRVRDVARRHPNLQIETDALATQVLFDDQTPPRAIGVEYRKGRKLYRPHGTPTDQGEKRIARVSRQGEVILSGGAFNTPQLLMLSGVGPQAQLDRWGIKPVKILDGVGKNLQDRYEIGVVHPLKQPWKALKDADFSKADKAFGDWNTDRSGIYITNGAILAVVRKSAAARQNVPKHQLPDLFCFGLVGNFHGYYPGYSRLFKEEKNKLTWAILKAHTVNHGGEVTLQSADPLVAPHVNFNYFQKGTEQDLEAVVEGIKFVRTLANKMLDSFLGDEEIPGRAVESDEQIKQFVRDHAWGHHASCTCKIGAEEAGGVLDSKFRVHGVAGLRVVDASIFPRIPGFFIVSSIYIAAEKAAYVIHNR